MTELNTWLPFSSCSFNLREDVHIWRVSFSVSSEELAGYQSLLSKDEIERANKFHFEIDRIRYIVTRGQLRFLLGKYLNKKADRFRFTYNKYGKPALSDSAIHFNVSHSNKMGLLF